MTDPLRIGIIGSNFGVKVLLPAFISTPNCKVVALCARPSTALSLFIKKTGFSNIYTDWKKMLKDESLDAIAIAVTPHAQALIAKTAIKKGIHIFGEKPLSTDEISAKELLALANKHRITHAVDFTFPEINAWQKTKSLIESGRFGKLQNISTNWQWLAGDIKERKLSWKTKTKDGGGILSLYFSHGLYYLEYFAGPIKKLESLFTYSPESLGGAESGIDVSITFKNGVTANAHVHGNYRGTPRHQLIFQCEKGVIILENKNAIVDNFSITTFTDGESTARLISFLKEKDTPDQDPRVKIARKPIARFVQACLAKAQTFPSFKEGLRVQILIEEARKNSFKA